MADFDSPWKDAIDCYFPSFIAFFFPDIHAAVDWSRGHEMLDKGLRQIVRDAELGRRHVDKLVKVWRKTAPRPGADPHRGADPARGRSHSQNLFRFIDRMMELPPALSQQFCGWPVNGNGCPLTTSLFAGVRMIGR